MEPWQKLLSGSAVKVEDLPFIPDSEEYREKLKRVSEIFPIRINSYFLEQIKGPNDPLWKQVVPTLEELDDLFNSDNQMESDPLNEEGDMPVPELIHRYPDRVLLMVNNQCPIICRFCTRKRKIGFSGIVTRETLRQGIEYIRNHKEVRDIILSGGDPLLVPDKELDRILADLRAIPHVEIIRIGTRVPGALPQRISQNLCSILKKHHPLYFNMHFNHPAELTPEVEKACNMLADTGIPLGSQTVLLKGVNDDVETMKTLMRKLLKLRIKPYYIYQADMTMGTNHFRTTVQKGLVDVIRLDTEFQ
ncbi:MAG: lysine 2,3-aminomutase, partial [Nitrospinae bacterium RIFCSPLOWO2_12_FULL_47_7]